MSGNFNMHGGGGSSSDMDDNQKFESLLAQLRRQSTEDSPTSARPHLMAHFNSFSQYRDSGFGDQDEGAESPRMSDSFSSFMPAAPTPPVGGPQFPPGMMAPGPIGSHRASLTSHSDPNNSAHLLNLLKFSGAAAGNQPSVPSRLHEEYSAPEPPIHQSMPSHPSTIHAPAPAAADPSGLLAALMKGSSLREDEQKQQQQQSQKPQQQQAAPQPSAPTWQSTSENADTQQYLLNLLNRPKPSQGDHPLSPEDSQPTTLTPQSAPEHALDRAKGIRPTEKSYSSASNEATPMPATVSPVARFDYESPKPPVDSMSHLSQESPASRPNMFTYKNPFDDLAATSPLNRTPKSSTTPSGAGPTMSSAPFQILKKPGSSHSSVDPRRPSSGRSPVSTPEHIRRSRIEASTSSLEHVAHHSSEASEPFSVLEPSKETVADAVNDLAEKADREAQEALARAEQEHAHAEAEAEIARDLEEMYHARTEEEFTESAHVAAQAIKKELDREENEHLLEDSLPSDVATTVKNIVDETANGPVADSWESADADEIVVIEEETTPVKVYQFPMKPWITITVQDGANEARPCFRDEVILDIARLKKDFDQIDRNLVTASENYMTYGMSKAGGLRVIRQMDGKDAKLFTDTKDRIFSVSMSSTPADVETAPKEAIIGTGISGTVYWVQLRNGDKDHIDDAHPEQYGFALPPLSSQEGDAPGGVLKTRARASINHPEFFAVGRGKSISIVWPSFIMQNNLFKPGHDRVVDTEKLSRQCSLKINTGKAGKDFTFSQDDTTVVSLDKSGRVKFWDVRDLIATKEGSDPRNPMPAETSLEVKEPLMTLTTTPEGEKAWPTSVMLLDKMRPYQKRTALRYMIVGMKQNHTLQLWDLALGKPVQEFNLPHSKESDPVCSVMYHPATGMIVVGHPTRNSIYFLHLSAPKYAMKNLSQVDYIQRLVAQDSSIPQPESTAVISGIREYSFANKGVLRSLDILPNPSTATDGDDQTLFELYAMHSKGVTCLFVKQGELGWSKDNKVITQVNAVDAGIVEISKLKSPPPQPEAHPAEEPATPQIRIASRGIAKDVLSTTPSSQVVDELAKKSADSLTPVRGTSKNENKDVDDTAATPAQPAPAEKPERKSRKKKAAAAAAAAAAQADRDRDTSNGVGNSPRILPTSKAAEPPKSSLSPSSFGMAIPDAVETRISSMENRLSISFDVSMRALERRLDDSYGAREAAFDDKQRRLLDLVTEVLDNNTQTVLAHIVRKEFENSVLPTIRDDMSKSVASELSGKIHNQVSNSVQREMGRALPNAVTQAFQRPEVLNAVSDKIVQSVTAQISSRLNDVFNQHIIPSFAQTAAESARHAATEAYRQASEEITRLERRQQAESQKVDQLLGQVARLSEVISTMANAQEQFQSQFLRVQSQLMQQQQQHQSQNQHHQSHPPQHAAPAQQRSAHASSTGGAYSSPGSSTAHAHHARAGPSHTQPTAPGGGLEQQILYDSAGRGRRDQNDIDQMAREIDSLMASRNYDEAMMKWLQAGDKSEQIFKHILVKYNPDFVAELPPLLLLSVGATASMDLSGELLREKLAWVEMVIVAYSNALPGVDEQVREITPKIMGILKSRIEQLFVRISSVSAQDPILKNMSRMVSYMNRITEGVEHRNSF